jgi:hypothetical protein
LYRGGRERDPFVAETMSEIYDDREKKAVFNHSLKDGLFNDLKKSPLKKKIPFNVQMYEPALHKRVYEDDLKQM